MALNPETEYAGRIGASSPSYPYGSAVNESAPGANDGTPLLASLVNDTLGFQQALLEAVGATPTGNEDTALASQYFDAIVELITRQVSWTGWFLADSFYTEVLVSIFAEDSNPNGISFKPDGTKMYMVGAANDTIYQYTLGTAWDLSTASYDSVSKSVTTEDTSPQGIFFKSDGTKMYMIGDVNDTVYQYTLGTAWDLSTASYDSVSKSVTTEDTVTNGISFKPDGLKMYMVGSTNDSIYQYTLSSAWDLSTASYDSVSKSVTTEDPFPISVFFKPDGTKMYVLGLTNDVIYQYTLATAWDLSTATYDSVSKSVTTEDTSPKSVFFKPDGTKMYVLGEANDNVYQYSTGKPYKGA